MRTRRGFTLIELLVVLTIIAILIGLLTPALMSAVRKARETQASTDIQVLAQALANFKTKYGDYPPSRVILNEDGVYGLTPLEMRSLRYLRNFWPRARFSQDPNSPVTLTPVKPGKLFFFDFNGNDTLDKGSYLLGGHQCLVFFLGGIPYQSATGVAMMGFGKNPLNPFTPAIDPDVATNSLASAEAREKPLLEFRPDRLVAPGGGFPGYLDTYSSPGQPRYLAYFSAYGGQYDPDDVNFSEADDQGNKNVGAAFQGNPVGPKGLVFSPAPNPYTNGPNLPLKADGSYDPSATRFRMTFMMPNSYQIISAGADGLYGIGGSYLQGKDDPLPYSPAANSSFTPPSGVILPTDEAFRKDREADNLSNFDGGPLGR